MKIFKSWLEPLGLAKSKQRGPKSRVLGVCERYDWSDGFILSNYDWVPGTESGHIGDIIGWLLLVSKKHKKLVFFEPTSSVAVAVGVCMYMHVCAHMFVFLCNYFACMYVYALLCVYIIVIIHACASVHACLCEMHAERRTYFWDACWNGKGIVFELNVEIIICLFQFLHASTNMFLSLHASQAYVSQFCMHLNRGLWII